MPRDAIFSRTTRIAKPLLVILTAFSAPEARADRISLRGGGEIRGKVVPDPARAGMVQLFGFKGKAPLAFKKEQIVQIVPEPSALDEYIKLRAQPRETGQADFDLGTWCEAHKLPDLAQFHFEETVRRDPENAAAHARLGHVLHDGKWLDEDGLRSAQGLVKYQGHWLTVEDKERREAQAATSNESRTWSRRLGKMIDAYRRGPDDRRREAEDALLEIREPSAIRPLLRVLGDAPEPEVRVLVARVLGAIPGPEAYSALVSLLLAESDEATRQATMTELARRDPAEVIPGLTRGLRSAQSEVINRAAWALSALNAVALVPRLVPALISVEYQVVMVPDTSVAPSPSPGFYIGGGPSIPIQTPAVVGPGSVAFGASSIPASALGGFGVSLGGGGGSPAMIPRMISYERKNVEVLAALVKLTGRDFGYDIPGWRQWVTTSFRIDNAAPARRIPQP